MTERMDWLGSSPVAGSARPLWARRALLWAGLLWTICVVAALAWLLRSTGTPSVLVIQEPGAAHPALSGRLHGIFKTDLGLTRVYPWILFGPYVALVAFLFPLERGRLLLSLPVNLAACVAFVTVSNALAARTRLAFSYVTVLRASTTEQGQSNMYELRVSRGNVDYEAKEQMVVHLLNSGSNAISLSGGERLGESSSANVTNLLTRAPPGWAGPPPAGLPGVSLWATLLNLIAYAAVAGLAHAVHFYRRFREREHRTLFLESNLANARLQALRAQLQPHFLFNSLNAIAALLRRDPRLAEATLMALSELLRLALSQSERQEVPLREELKFTERYLEIQQTRFGNKLRIEEAVDPEALNCLVPTLVLQPLVENAIRHGLEPMEDTGLVRLTAQRNDGKLLLSVEDDGAGLKMAEQGSAVAEHGTVAGAALVQGHGQAATNGTGIGLRNLRARLETLYGSAQKLELLPRAERGVLARVEIPWHSSTALESPQSSES